MFLTLLVIGLVGLLAMTVPAFGRHGHAHPAHGPANGLGRGTPIGPRHAAAGRAGVAGRSEILVEAPAARRFLRHLPSPRAICSVLALYGAFGNALTHAAHLRFEVAAFIALAPALLVEWAVVRPVWNLVFRFQGRPSSPLAELLFAEATAVVPFRNGRGVVSVVRDGRHVQLAARLAEPEASAAVRVGDRLRVEDVDVTRERVTVSVISTTGSLTR